MQSDPDQKRLREEIAKLKKLTHPHVAQYLGDAMHDGRIVIVTEYAVNGSLQRVIPDRRVLSWEEKDRIAQEIIRALAYIHNMGILHCDLKSSNVLLDHSMRAKICDFGLSTVSNVSTNVPGEPSTVRWMAPELFTQPVYTTKSDMYALGCILWEMASNSTPPFKDQVDIDIVISHIKCGKRDEIPTDTPDEYRQWIDGCLSIEPMKRPEAIAIARKLTYFGVEVSTSMEFVLTDRSVDAGHIFEARLAFLSKRPCVAKLIRIKNTVADRTFLRREMALLRLLKHPHLIRFLGDTVHNGRLVLLMEYAEMGSLQSIIRSRGLSTWSEKERLAQEIAMGLAYLHSQGLLHRDLKSGNVLLDNAMRAKICDFGLSTVYLSRLSTSSGWTRSNGATSTVRWMAPELLSPRPKFTTKSDVYALGCIMWEMAANSTPPFRYKRYDEMVVFLVQSGKREEIPADTPDEFRRRINLCWEQDPMDRADAVDIVFDSFAETTHQDETSYLDIGSSYINV
ncbi:Serine/threonine-protein kinase 36 [Actinomortierella ambigua]|nr:Serine/threonine-protein kinase 36 [Actinomortierella ambigua]